MDWRDCVSVNPQVMHGMACTSGTRIPVSVVLDNLAASESVDAILTEWPSLAREAVAAALACAAELARARVIALPA